jgi:hypothetical protein
MSTWADLEALRATGQRPRLPLIVTTRFERCREAADAGAMVIVHQAGERFPVELLAGLETDLYLEDCSQATAVARLIRERNVRAACVRVWCQCEKELMRYWHANCRQCEAEIAAWNAFCDRSASAGAAA